jgi:Cu/Ag efflux protein CusF
MVSIPKIVGVLSCGFLLCLGLSNAAQAGNVPGASDVMKTDSQTDRQGFQSDDDKQKNVDDKMGSAWAEDAKTITGELFRVEDGNYFVKVKDGKEVRLHTDKTTKMMGEIKKGDRIEAQVNNQNHALSIRSARGTEK